MKRIILLLALVGPSVSFAAHCPLASTQRKVLQAAVSIESINGFGRPLTTELYSYSSKLNTWAVILSYSGIRNVWAVETSEDGCQIKSVYK